MKRLLLQVGQGLKLYIKGQSIEDLRIQFFHTYPQNWFRELAKFMKFKYKKIASGLIRPIIPVTLHYKGKSLRYEALVDSGADMCMFPAQIGEIIGIDIKKGEKGDLGGVVGKTVDAYYHEIDIEIGGNKIHVKVGFTEESRFDHGFLGQIGVFNSYTVHFFYRKGVVELRPDVRVN